jgi:hypothetical protein
MALCIAAASWRAMATAARTGPTMTSRLPATDCSRSCFAAAATRGACLRCAAWRETPNASAMSRHE